MGYPNGGRAVRCPACGRTAVPAGPYCPVCGRHLAPVPIQWVAMPPPEAIGPPPAPPRPAYRGAPRYPFIPRWGFPARAWEAPADGERPPVDAVYAARSLAASAVPLLWATVVVASLAAAGEIWRYVLLVLSRDRALPATVVAASDALVTAAGLVAPLLAVVSGIVVVMWTVRASAAAAEQARVLPSRSRRAIVLAWVVPFWNLANAGSVLSEIEHTVLARPAAERPRPSRLLLAWWAAWVVGGVLAAVVIAWSFLPGVQAQADGVELHALLDLVAAAAAGLLAVVIVRINRLVGPARSTPREILMAVGPPAALA
jgi:hypothetical protein